GIGMAMAMGRRTTVMRMAVVGVAVGVGMGMGTPRMCRRNSSLMWPTKATPRCLRWVHAICRSDRMRGTRKGEREAGLWLVCLLFCFVLFCFVVLCCVVFGFVWFC